MGNILAHIADAFALVGFGRALFAHFRGKLADTLFVDAVDNDLERIGNFNGDAVCFRDDDRV